MGKERLLDATMSRKMVVDAQLGDPEGKADVMIKLPRRTLVWVASGEWNLSTWGKQKLTARLQMRGKAAAPAISLLRFLDR